MDTLPIFRKTIHDAGLEGTVVAVVGDSPTVASAWATPLEFLFIHGVNGAQPARLDSERLTPHVMTGGTFFIHYLFPAPASGGPPHHHHTSPHTLSTTPFTPPAT